MSALIEEIIQRRSIRQYKPDAVEPAKLNRVLEAGRLAPTARNTQDWQIIVVEDESTRLDLVTAAAPHQTFLKQAPIMLAACGLNTDYIMKCGHHAYLINLSIVLDHISLQAVREGLGTCWIGSFDQAAAKKILHIPGHIQIVQLMSLGYPAAIPSPTPRKTQAELFLKNHWHE